VEEVSLPAMAVRLAISMGVVLGLMLLAARLLRRAQGMARTAGSGAGGRRGRARTVTPLAVTGVAPLGRGASVALVRAAGHDLVLGVTEQQVTLLHRIPVELLEAPEDTTGPQGAGSRGATSSIELDLDLPEATARIAVAAAEQPAVAAGTPAWTDALETLRAMTVRR
jgi:flagellar biogenesis protein FliO